MSTARTKIVENNIKRLRRRFGRSISLKNTTSAGTLNYTTGVLSGKTTSSLTAK